MSEWTDKIQGNYERGRLTFQARGYAFERLEDFGRYLDPKLPADLEPQLLLAAVLKRLVGVRNGEVPATPEFKAVVDQHLGYHSAGLAELTETPLDEAADGLRLLNGDFDELATTHIRELILHTENATPKAREHG